MSNKKVERWTYLGVEPEGTTKAHIWELPSGERKSFAKDLTRESPQGVARPGSIWDVTVELNPLKPDTTSVHPTKPQYAGMVDAERLAGLQALSRAGEAELRKRKQAKDDMSVDAVREALAPVTREMHRRNPAGRRALLAVIIDEVMMGRVA